MKNDLRQSFHLEPLKGWLNDPNGLCFFNNAYHVYFQYAPGSAKGADDKCWGHFRSKDLLSWEFTGTVLFPDTPDDKNGVYSGSGIVRQDTLYLFYTGNVMQQGDYDYITAGREANTILVTTKDGVTMSEKKVVLRNSDYPTEEEQFRAYKRVLESMAGKKVIIRTLDIGADKQIDYFGLEKEDNPALGFRAIRICLTRPQIFETQLRALYRASVYGELGIMFPMITSVSELEKIRQVCEKVKTELAGEGIPVAENVEIGIMIETPAAAVISDRLAPMVDFFSVGTNDLTQYTLACDRQNAALEQFVDPHHEAILRLIEMSANNAHANGAWIGICGELAADLSLTETFLRMGIDELSVAPPFVLPLREKIRCIDLSK